MNKIKSFINKHFFSRKHYFDKFVKFKDLKVEQHFNHLPYTNGIGFPQWHYFSVIQMNSTFIEMTDEEYYQIGFSNFLIICFGLFGGSLILQILYIYYEFY